MFITPHALAVKRQDLTVKRHGAFWFCKVKVKGGVCPNFYDVFSDSPYFWCNEPLRVLRSWAANVGYRKAVELVNKLTRLTGLQVSLPRFLSLLSL